MTEENDPPVPAVAVDPGASAPLPKARRNRVVIVLAVVFLLAAGTFGTLWFVERGDHRTTAEQLNDRETRLADVQAKLDKAQKDLKDADARTMNASSGRAKLEDDLTQARLQIDSLSKDRSLCDKAGRAFVRGLSPGGTGAMDITDMISNCR